MHEGTPGPSNRRSRDLLPRSVRAGRRNEKGELERCIELLSEHLPRREVVDRRVELFNEFQMIRLSIIQNLNYFTAVSGSSAGHEEVRREFLRLIRSSKADEEKNIKELATLTEAMEMNNTNRSTNDKPGLN